MGESYQRPPVGDAPPHIASIADEPHLATLNQGLKNCCRSTRRTLLDVWSCPSLSIGHLFASLNPPAAEPVRLEQRLLGR
jgi:hypothetical protein